MTKICSKCHKEKSIDDFHLNKTKKDGHQNQCKECKKLADVKWKEGKSQEFFDHQRDYSYQRLYGFTLEEYNKMFEEQHGCCIICGKHQTELTRILSVEHNHKTHQVRGLACDRCNSIIAVVEDNSDLIEKVREYLAGYIEYN